jgi:hypothetical protein
MLLVLGLQVCAGNQDTTTAVGYNPAPEITGTTNKKPAAEAAG